VCVPGGGGVTKQRSEEQSDEEADSRHASRETGAAALPDAGGGLDEDGEGAGGHEGAHHDAHTVGAVRQGGAREVLGLVVDETWTQIVDIRTVLCNHWASAEVCVCRGGAGPVPRLSTSGRCCATTGHLQRCVGGGTCTQVVDIGTVL